MIFASDLDRTLIYSKRFLFGNPSFEVVERIEEKDIAHMTKKAVQLLKEVNKEITFIPVTTRTEEEYKRIQLMEELSPKYAIVSNGGKILINGKEDEKWKEHIKITLETKKHNLEQIRELFFSYTEKSYFNLEKCADNMFWMFRLNNEGQGKSILSQLQPIMKEYGWDLTQTGRKMYLLPEELTKWNALTYLCSKLSETYIIAAGDSLMDLEMVSNATIGITPLHGEIVETEKITKNMIVTESEGVLAGEEILEFVCNKCGNKARA